MTDLNPRYVHVVIDHFRPRVMAEMARVEAEMKAEYPGCSIFRYHHAAGDFLERPGMWKEDKMVLAFVQCRLVSGAIHSGSIWVGLGTGDVWVTGWPLEEKSGWGRAEGINA